MQSQFQNVFNSISVWMRFLLPFLRTSRSAIRVADLHQPPI